ncbi:MAG: FG-GAP-like repeat-containing protein [Bacteroidales bacterium]|jgi:hypothetical protein|nr:FG-GAP-like repeat-containing protein [Bacteroidales bacterium]
MVNFPFSFLLYLFSFILPIICALISPNCQAQINDFGFIRNQNIEVLDYNGNNCNYAWAGGMNSVRFSEIDIDRDGIKDLFIFEKNGNRILPFIRLGDSNFRYAPEYVHCFPKLHDWAILIDHDGDGKEDIFTYGLAGITVYRNISEESLAFELITEQLMSNYYGNLTNIYASPDDYLAIADIDGDGDLDILNFWALGMYVHYQKNWAMENHGRCDTFDFKLEDECWGKFHEGEENNEIMLFSDCGNDGSKRTRHIGSSMYVIDYNNDGLTDLVLGDVDYPGLLLLTNGGSQSEALMVSQNPDFPNANTPVRLYSMPAVNFLDINRNGTPDLIVSPSDPSLKKSENINSVWMYEYNSSTQHYELTTKSFLQNEMIDVGSGALPVLHDWDGDGLLDLFVGNFGRYDSSKLINGFLTSYYSSSITYFKNIGTSEQPKFQLISEDFGGLRQHGFTSLYPAFADFNNDGLTDVLCGTEDGSLTLFLNNGTQNNPLFNNPTMNYENINVRYNSAPQLFDLDGDGNVDLLIGNRRGHISYFRNVGDNQYPSFVKITDTLGNVDVRDYNMSYFGYNTSLFFKNGNGETVLFCGNEKGTVFYYKNIDNNLDGEFELVLDVMHELEGNIRRNIREGAHSAITVADLNNDGFLDLIVGNWAGGLTYFEGTRHPDSTVGIRPSLSLTNFTVYPNPCQHYFQIDFNENIQEECCLLLYDLQGRLVLSQTIANRDIIHVSHLHRGVYMGITHSSKVKNNFKIVLIE